MNTEELRAECRALEGRIKAETGYKTPTVLAMASGHGWTVTAFGEHHIWRSDTFATPEPALAAARQHVDACGSALAKTLGVEE